MSRSVSTICTGTRPVTVQLVTPVVVVVDDDLKEQ